MGLIIFVIVVVMIAIIAYLLAYIVHAEPIPPYQQPVKRNQDCNQGENYDCATPNATWPFPISKP